MKRLIRSFHVFRPLCIFLILILLPSFALEQLYSTMPVWTSDPEYSTISVAAGDIDMNGDLDLVCANWKRPNTIYINNNGIFDESPAVEFDAQTVTRSIALGDVDGNGYLDIVCANNGHSNTLYLNNNGVFEESPSWSSDPANNTRDAAFVDIDGDPLRDCEAGRCDLEDL